MTRAAPILALLLTSSVLSRCSSGSSILCSWTKVIPDTAEVHHSFLRLGEPGLEAPVPVRLYHSVWARERVLLGCAWSDDTAAIREYLTLCQEGVQEFSNNPDERSGYLFEAEEPCVKVSSPPPRTEASSNHREEAREPCVKVSSPVEGTEEPSHHREDKGSSPSEGEEEEKLCVKAPAPLLEVRRPVRRSVRSVGGGGGRSGVRSRQRVKRGFIVPGTLWCGTGNKAPSYEDLGAFSATDSCCREHDQCKHTILSFHSQFGVFNSNIFTMSHCDCDNKFRRCLMEAKDSISDVVGYTFFNLLKLHCFQFSHRLQCTQRNWFGMCKETKMALYATVHPPTLYVSAAEEEHLNSTGSIIEATSSVDPLEGSLSNTQLLATPPPPTTIALVNHFTPEEPSRSDVNSLPSNNQRLSEQDAALPEIQSSCGVFKDLDECGDVILPQQSKHGLHNSEPSTLYHCNCTSRLFQTVARQRQLTQVQSLLLGHVSPACFLPQDCSAGSSCPAVLVKAEFPQSGLEEQQRHLPVIKLKVLRSKLRRAKRRGGAERRGGGAERLYRQCVRMSSARQSNRTRRLME